MQNLLYDKAVALEMVFVLGTDGRSFLFGNNGERQAVNIKDFFLAKFQVTQAVWKYVMNEDDSRFDNKGDNLPATNLSWTDITTKGGFLARLNNSDIIKELCAQLQGKNKMAAFRLPSETEWEYAARGGDNWGDNFVFAGSNDPNKVAWYKENSDNHTWPVGQKAPNQLGLYDMCGNIWEWCEDYHTRDASLIPKDGSPFLYGGTDRVLRGGCHHNMAVHCTSTKRYEIIPEAADGCIGLRLAMSL